MDFLRAAYAEKHSNIMAHLATINECMQNIPEHESESLTWANLGDLARLENDLTEILEYLD